MPSQSTPAPSEGSLFVNRNSDSLVAYFVVDGKGDLNLFSDDVTLSKRNIQEIVPTESALKAAAAKVEGLGFKVGRIGRSSIRVQASEADYANQFGVEFKRDDFGRIEPTQESSLNLIGPDIGGVSGIVFPEPAELHSVKDASPPLKYYHLEVPNDVGHLLGANLAHLNGFQGGGVKAAMIDSGFDASHPFFAKHGYQLRPHMPTNSHLDSNGHGTGESANFFAIAPKVELHGIRMGDIVEAFQVARDDLGVKIISNSWGTSYPTDGSGGYWHPFWKLVEEEIILCQQDGIIVLFSGGNGGMSFTASMPETISVGGVYVDSEGNRMASDYVSSFDSVRYPGEHVPNLCGLCGMRPGAMYISLPVPPKSELDADLSGGIHPNGDETASDDGWATFSGTSAACPMVAGAAALVLGKYPNSTFDQVKERLEKNCVDVEQGATAMGDSASPGWDKATGHGLVDASASLQ